MLPVFRRSPVLGSVFLFPQLLLTLCFFIWPVLWVWRDAFYFVDPFGLHRQFAGLQNIIEVLSEPSYLQALKTTGLLVFGITSMTIILGFSLAMLLQQVSKGRAVYKMLLIWPYAVAPAIAAILWRFLLHPSFGWIQQILHFFNLEANYLVHPNTAICLVIGVAVWQQLSYNVMFFFVSLEALPKSLIEAAMLDGASVWQRFWRIRLPTLMPTVYFLALMNSLYAFFDTFPVIDILTSGGPGNRTTTLLYKLYKDGLVGMDWSSAAAQSLSFMVIVMLCSIVQFRFLGKRTYS